MGLEERREMEGGGRERRRVPGLKRKKTRDKADEATARPGSSASEPDLQCQGKGGDLGQGQEGLQTN